MFKGPCDLIGSTRIIQNNLPSVGTVPSAEVSLSGSAGDCGMMRRHWVGVCWSLPRADWPAWPQGLRAGPPPTMAQSATATVILESLARVFLLLPISYAHQALITPRPDFYNLVPPEFVCTVCPLHGRSQWIFLLKTSPGLPVKSTYLNLTSRSFPGWPPPAFPACFAML